MSSYFLTLRKSDKASKKENDCNVSQVSLVVNPVPVMYIFGVFRQFFAIFDPKSKLAYSDAYHILSKNSSFQLFEFVHITLSSSFGAL